MRLVTYRQGKSGRLGALHCDWVVDLQRAEPFYYQAVTGAPPPRHARLPSNMLDFLRMGPPALETARRLLDYVQELNSPAEREALIHARALIPFSQVILTTPIPRPGKIICIGANYPSGQADCAPPAYPTVFLKPSSGLIGSGEPIRLPPITRDVAYEAELVVVIGSRAKYLSIENAPDCIVGYSQANDIGARDLEKRTSQWTSGKIMDTFCPIGPALVTADEVLDPGHLPLTTLLNGRMVQHSNTQDMYFNIPFLISYLSQLTTLEPGDLILTGSPKTIDGQPAPLLSLKPGDCVEIQIGNLGNLRNPVIAEAEEGVPRKITPHPWRSRSIDRRARGGHLWQ